MAISLGGPRVRSWSKCVYVCVWVCMCVWERIAADGKCPFPCVVLRLVLWLWVGWSYIKALNRMNRTGATLSIFLSQSVDSIYFSFFHFFFILTFLSCPFLFSRFPLFHLREGSYVCRKICKQILAAHLHMWNPTVYDNRLICCVQSWESSKKIPL